MKKQHYKKTKKLLYIKNAFLFDINNIYLSSLYSIINIFSKFVNGSIYIELFFFIVINKNS